MGFQAYLGGICETIGTMMRQLSKNKSFMNFRRKLKFIPIKYDLNKLEIRSYTVNIPHHLHSTNQQKEHELTMVSPTQTSSSSSSSKTSIGVFEEVNTEIGYFYYDDDDSVRDDSLFTEDENTRLLKKTDEIRDLIEESVIKANNESRKVALSLLNELQDIKRRLIPK